MWKMYILRSDIHCVKYVKLRASFDPYFLVYDSVLIRENVETILLSITGKYGSEKARIAAMIRISCSD